MTDQTEPKEPIEKSQAKRLYNAWYGDNVGRHMPEFDDAPPEITDRWYATLRAFKAIFAEATT